MKIKLSPPPSRLLKGNTLEITGSKSESNRLLLLQSLFPGLTIENLSNSDDATVMRQGINQGEGIIDIHHAGTAMRFLTAYFASRAGSDVTLTGSKRMTERPVRILVEALKSLGADIHYLKEEGYPPIRIKGKGLKGGKVSLPANVSSQYISALLLVGPSLSNGLDLELLGKITSVPYIRMTLGLLDQLQIKNSFEANRIRVWPASRDVQKMVRVESDWSSASYFYSIAALSEPGSQIKLTSYSRESLQGDSVLQHLYKELGVETRFEGHTLILSKNNAELPEKLEANLADAPDIAQTISATCFGLGISCELTGLHTLKIKETDRLEAMKTELGKMGARISVTNDTLSLGAGGEIQAEVVIDTYNDHRMAMAFAPLALRVPLEVNDAEVVSKSYPDYWKDLERLSFGVSAT